MFASPDNHHCHALSPNQITGPIRVHMHLQRCIWRLSCTRQHASHVLHQISTQPFEFLHVSTPRLFHVSREAFHCFSNFNSVLINIRQLHHQAAVQNRLRWRDFLRSFNLCCLLFSSPDTWWIDAFCTIQLHALQSVLNKFRVSLQRHLIIQHINSDCSIQDLQILLVVCTKSNVACLFHLKSFLKDFSKGDFSCCTRAQRRRKLVTLWASHKKFNLKQLPRTGNFRMFMNEVFSHFHLQLVTLYTSSDLWLNFLCSQFADFSRFHARVQQRGKLITWRTSHKKFRLFSILHSSEFCFVIFKAEVPHCSVGSCSRQIHCDPFTESPSSHMMQTSTDWVLLWSHTRSTHSGICTTPWPHHRWDLRPCTVVWVILQSSRTPVLLGVKLFMHCSSKQSKMFICSGAASAASPTTSSTLHVLCANTSTYASRCYSSASAANSSTSSPCLYWPGLSVNLTRFVSRSSVFVSLALEPAPDRVPEPDDPPNRTMGTGCETDCGVDSWSDCWSSTTIGSPTCTSSPASGHHLPRALQCGLGICHHEELSHCACLTLTPCMLDTRLCIRTSRDLSSWRISSDQFSELQASQSQEQRLDLPLPRVQEVSPDSVAIPSLVFHHSCNSRSSLHTIWREEIRSTRSLVMSDIDTA